MMSKINVEWVKFGNSEGPRFKGSNGFVPMMTPDAWDRILGVISGCEGNYDTVVMYDGTGVTFGFMQWTFTSGRLQKFLEYLKSRPSEEVGSVSLFDSLLLDKSTGSQLFERFGFRIEGAEFRAKSKDGSFKTLSPDVDKETIRDICLGKKDIDGNEVDSATAKEKACDLCRVFALLGFNYLIQAEQRSYAMAELNREMGAKRPPLFKYGGTIKSMVPYELFATPVYAIYLSLFQNSPGLSFKFIAGVMRKCLDAKLVSYSENRGYRFNLSGDPDVYKVLDILWMELCNTDIANWGYGSKKSNRSPRVDRIRASVKKYYGMELGWPK